MTAISSVIALKNTGISRAGPAPLDFLWPEVVDEPLVEVMMEAVLELVDFVDALEL